MNLMGNYNNTIPNDDNIIRMNEGHGATEKRSRRGEIMHKIYIITYHHYSHYRIVTIGNAARYS